MATVIRKTRLVNPARRKRRRRRRNLSAKQIKFFGTPAQKAALRRRKRNASSALRRSQRIRSSHRRRRARINPGEIITFGLAGLGNPAKRRKSVAKRNKSTRRRRRSNPVNRAHHRRARRTNASPKRHRMRRHRNSASRRRRRNPESVSSLTGTVVKAGWAIGGAVGTRMLTQIALGSNNTGIVGYVANAVAAMGLGWAGKKFVNAPGEMITIGGFVALLLRIIEEQTPFGNLLQSAGMSGLGDVGIYGATTFFVPLAEAGGKDRGQLAMPGVISNLQNAVAAAQAASAAAAAAKSGQRSLPAGAAPSPAPATGVGRYGPMSRLS